MAARSFVIAFVACLAVLGVSIRAHAAPVAFTAGKAPGSTADMTVQVDPKTAAFTVAIDGVNWLSGGEVAVQAAGTWHTSSGTAPTLKLDGGIGQTFAGGDSTGLYSATQFTWLLPPGTAHPTSAATQARMVTTVRVYNDVSAVAFEQRFPDGLADTSVGNTDAVLSSFPTFGEVLPEGDDLGYTSYWGAFIGNSHSGRWWNSTSDPFFGGKAGGPFVVYDNSMQNSLVVSPFSQFMAASFYEDTSQPQKVIRAGIMGGVMSLPPGYSLDTIVYHGAGFNQAVHEWGATLLQRYGKNANGPAFDYTARNLGYNTDHGSYYYYNTEPGKNYLETLTDVYHYSQSAGIPYKFILLDSWWYFKGERDGVYNWTAMPSVFPGGNKGMQNLTLTTNWQVIAHNRYWSANTNYAKQNGGDWDFVVENSTQLSIPTEEAFWDYLMSSSRKWGLDVYEQDWLYNEFEWMNVTLSNATIARTWLLQMGNAAARNGVAIQYCMPFPRHALQSVEIPAVQQIRASNDYVPGSLDQQWQIGTSSILANALALSPFKDNFWTTTNQPGNPYNGAKELYPALESAVATLSTGPVTPSDGIGLTNVSLVMRSCASDGMLLQPSEPATSIDSTFLFASFGSNGPNGQLWSTYSQIGFYRWFHVFGAEMVAEYDFTPADLGAALAGAPVDKLVAYTLPTSSLSVADMKIGPFSASSPLAVPVCGRADFQLSHIAPQFSSGWTLLGELDKWVPVSPARFRSVQHEPSGITLQLAGAVGEVVHVSFADPSFKVTSVDVAIQPNGRATVFQPTASSTTEVSVTL